MAGVAAPDTGESVGAADDLSAGPDDAGEGVSGSPEVTERLLDAAVDVFAERGFEAARVAEIARRAGLTTGAIYARWQGKRDLIVEAVRHIVGQYVHASSVVAATPARDVLAVLGADPASARDARILQVVLEAMVSARRDDSFRAAVSDVMSEERAGLSSIVARGKAEGSIDPSLSTPAIVALCQCLGLGRHLAVSGEMASGRVQAGEWDALVSRLMAALRPVPG